MSAEEREGEREEGKYRRFKLLWNLKWKNSSRGIKEIDTISRSILELN